MHAQYKVCCLGAFVQGMQTLRLNIHVEDHSWAILHGAGAQADPRWPSYDARGGCERYHLPLCCPSCCSFTAGLLWPELPIFDLRGPASVSCRLLGKYMFLREASGKSALWAAGIVLSSSPAYYPKFRIQRLASSPVLARALYFPCPVPESTLCN